MDNFNRRTFVKYSNTAAQGNTIVFTYHTMNQACVDKYDLLQ